MQHRKMRRTIRAGALIGIAALAAAGCSSSKKSTATKTATTAAGAPASTGGAACGAGTNTASAPGVTPDAIKIGLISDLTGVASSTFFDTPLGVQARIDVENAKGGVCGRKIQLVTVDTTSSPTAALTAAQDLVNKGVFAIIGYSAFLFGDYRYLQQQGIPVTGGGFDGVEWGQQPNTNMFTYTGGFDAHYPANTVQGLFLKSLGVTNVGGIAYGISPSSTASIKALKFSVESQGMKMTYENLSFPFGGVDFTAPVLAMKKAGVDAAVCSCVQSSNIALITAAKQGGMNLRAEMSFSGADSSLFSNATATQAAQGAYFTTGTPLDQHLPAVDAYAANLRKYDPSYKGGYPSLGVSGGYLSMDLMIKGLQVAGRNPTRQAFISNLAQVTGYNAGGLIPGSVSFNHFGTAEPKVCQYFEQVKGNDFTTVTPQPICGTLIPNSNST